MLKKDETPRKAYVPAVGPRLSKLLSVIFALLVIMVVDSVYLVSITIAGVQYQNWFYLVMFLVHLVLGLVLLVPVVVFGLVHMSKARHRPNKRAIRAGYALFTAALLLFVSGIVLMRVEVFGVRLEVNSPAIRSLAYWLHVLLPLVVAWLFVLHRLAGKRINWRVGIGWGAFAAVFAGVCLVVQAQDPRDWNVTGPASGVQYFFPSLARTSTGNFIPAEVLDNNQYCLKCHEDVHEGWAHSAHRFASFNNPAYEFSVKETRRAMMERDGNVHGSRFCAGCHDVVPFFSGAFDDPRFDDPEYDLSSDPQAQAGITCTACHAISHINSVRGNADYTITEPIHYPFAFSDSSFLQWVNEQLVKAKPEFHKATFLKPLHKTAQFCGSCHKVHLPEELNGYKWLRGQNHYDAFWLSGVSGYGITSFYYPPVAQANCNGCHMPLQEVGAGVNFAARVRDESGRLKTLNHQFPSANTGILHMLRDQLPDADRFIEAHREFLDGVMRLDIIGVKDGGTIDSPLIAPLRPDVPTLRPGQTYLLETVIRTMKMGHVFTQGTADSNEVWLEVTATQGGRTIGLSGGLDPKDRSLDEWAHRVNAFVIDREGNRINRRNAQDIFIALYNNQIPPGAADVVHYRLKVPEDSGEPITVRARLFYRKFDTEYMRLVEDDPNYVNDLPIITLATDQVTFPVAEGTAVENEPSDIPLWQRWNDYGIALLRKGGQGELRQAADAFSRVEALGLPDGPLNLARVYIREGLIQTHAPEALARAASMDPPAPPWSLLWFGSQVAKSNGDLDKAIENLREIIRGGFVEAEGRNFDFAKDYRVLTELGGVLYQRGLQEAGATRQQMMEEARDWYDAALALDPENLNAHWGLKQVYADLGETQSEQYHAQEHAKYKPDDNASDYAVAQARLKYPAANVASEAVVIYDLQRDLSGQLREVAITPPEDVPGG